MSNLFWVRSQNFGDNLNVLLHKAITGKEPVFATPEQPETIIAVGSLAHTARPNNILWGTGAMADDMPPEHCNKTTVVRAVRGPLTAWMFQKQGVDISNAIFADPAILIPRFFPVFGNGNENRKVLVVPHYADCERAVTLPWGENCQVLHPMKDTEFLIKEIAGADSVITSSLHILVVAESYGVPAVWVEFSDNVRGKGFKFIDWYLSTIRTPPAAIQIRGSKIPWEQINEAVYSWTEPGIDLQELGDILLDVCPF